MQNIDMMNLAGFCRNCLANWTADAAKERGLELNKEEAEKSSTARPYKDWQAKYQKDVSARARGVRDQPAEGTSGRCFGPVAAGARQADYGPGRGAHQITNVHAFLLAPLAIRGMCR